MGMDTQVGLRETSVADRLTEIEMQLTRADSFLQGALFRLTGESSPNVPSEPERTDILWRLGRMAEMSLIVANRAEHVANLVGEDMRNMVDIEPEHTYSVVR